MGKMDHIELTLPTDPGPLADREGISLEELAKQLGISEDDAFALLEPLDKNMTVGDVHVATSLKDISVAYGLGEEGPEEEEEGETAEEEEAEQAARKINEEHDDAGRFASGGGGGGGSEGGPSSSDLSALSAAGTDRGKFEAAHAALSSDKSMTLSHLKAIAGKYMGGHIHSSGATRGDVLRQLESKFTENARYQNKLKIDMENFDYEEGGNVSAEHLKAVDMLQGRLSRGQNKDYAVRAVCAECEMTPAVLRRAYNAVHGRIRRPGDGQKLDKINEEHDEAGPQAILKFQVAKIDPDQCKVFGWASVSAIDGEPVIDKQDDIIPIEELEKAAHDFTLFSRTQGDMHTDIGVGRLIEPFIFDADKRDAGAIAKDDKGRAIDGWWVGFLVDDEGVWQAHKRGERLEFSIGGRARREVQKINEEHDDAGRFASGGGGGGSGASNYVNSLTASFERWKTGDSNAAATEFRAVLNTIAQDKSVTSDHLKEIARSFLGYKVSGSRASMINAMDSRLRNLEGSKARAEATAGRTAA